MRFFHRVMALCRKVGRSWEQCRHTPHTMVQYLRKRGASVGENCFIVPTDLDLEIEPGRLKIGDHVAIAAGVRFLKEREACPPSIDGTLSSGEIVIEDNCFIGLRSIIYPNVRIGPNSVIGAGSVVWSDVPPDSVVMGVPARPFGSLERYREKCFHSWFEQRPPGVVIEPGATWWNTRHFALNHELLRRHLLKRFHKELS